VSPEVPAIWPIAKGTNVSNEGLKDAGFQITCLATPERSALRNLSACKVGSSSKRKKWRHGISKEAQKRLEAASSMVATFMEEVIVSPKLHVVFRILTQNPYDVHIKEAPSCTCPDFQRR